MIRLISLVAFLLVTTSSLSAAEFLQSHQVRVVDGDTIRLNDARPDVRLVGFNAPETRRAMCEQERELGGKATRRLRDLVRSGASLELESIKCSCRPGTEGTDACNFGRRCGVLKVGGRDVGEILIAEGLAVSFTCGATSCPPTPKPWCR